MTHRSEQLGRRIDQNLDDLEVRNPKTAKQLEEKYRRLAHETNFAVSMSRVPGHIREAERQQ